MTMLYQVEHALETTSTVAVEKALRDALNDFASQDGASENNDEPVGWGNLTDIPAEILSTHKLLRVTEIDSTIEVDAEELFRGT